MVAVAVLGAASASAQKYTHGLAAGYNISSFSGDLWDEYESKPGYQFSWVHNIAFNESFSVTPEFSVIEGGAKLKSGGDISLHYARIPISATYKFKGSDRVRVFVFAGPYMGYGLRSSEVKPDSFGSKTDGYKFNPWDFGFNIGVGYQTGGGVFHKFQYSHGLTNVQNELQGAKDGGNINFALTIGYLF